MQYALQFASKKIYDVYYAFREPFSKHIFPEKEGKCLILDIPVTANRYQGNNKYYKCTRISPEDVVTLYTFCWFVGMF